MRPGVSIAICCFNSAARLPETLRCLAAQQVMGDIAWEVIIVDNACSDDTPQVARQLWSLAAQEKEPAVTSRVDTEPRLVQQMGPSGVPLRVVAEPRLGLSFARRRALIEAQYEFISFIDDDNWVDPDWVTRVFQTLNAHPEAAACGGVSQGVFEIAPPAWYARFYPGLAVGAQAAQAGDISAGPGVLWGAGLSVRAAAWKQMLSAGFDQILLDRHGKMLSSGGDSELCYALLLAGWRLWYNPELRLQHFIPAARIQWQYLRRLHRELGKSSAIVNLYYALLRPRPGYLRTTWPYKLGSILWNLSARGGRLLRAYRKGQTGDPAVLQAERLLGQAGEILRQRGSLERQYRALRGAAWIGQVNGDKAA